MKKIFTIAFWEFVEKVKRKSFIFSMIITPLILFGLVYVGSISPSQGKEFPTYIGVIDQTGCYDNNIIGSLKDIKLKNGQPSFILLNLSDLSSSLSSQLNMAEELTINRSINGFIYIYNVNPDSLGIKFRSGGMSQSRDFLTIQDAVKEAILKYRMQKHGLISPEINAVFQNTKLEQVKIEDNRLRDENDFITTFLTGYFFILLLLIMILLTGGMFVRSIVEEKSNRIIEVILSSCNIEKLLGGKILGLSLLGLFQIFIWILIGGLFFSNEHINLALSPNLGLQITYFILGYFLYTSIFVGIGSIVNTEHEAQQVTANLSIILILPILISAQVLLNPDSYISLILSYFPLTTAPSMILRLNVLDPSLSEVLLTSSISIISIYFIIRLSSKIFKIGILSYDKIPSIKMLIERANKISN
ncbi:ABC transporter permease [Bacteroidota bacterium]